MAAILRSFLALSSVSFLRRASSACFLYAPSCATFASFSLRAISAAFCSAISLGVLNSG